MTDRNHTDPEALRRIGKLPECLQPHMELNDPCWSYCPPGWRSLVEELHYNLVAIHPNYQIRQIKEKFGGLRFYTNIPYDATDEGCLLIQDYENQSHSICDICGGEGEKRFIDKCFMAVRCDTHNTSDELRAKVSEYDR